MTQPKIPKLLGLGFGRGRAKRPQLDVVDGGKAVKEHDKLDESLAQTQASGDTQAGGEVDRAISLARTMAVTAGAARETAERVKETGPASFAETVAPAGDLAPASSPALAESTPALMRTMAATADELTDSAKRSAGESSGLENSLARTMIATDPGASGSLEAEALDAESLGFARTITPQDAARSQGSRDSRGSRPSLRRDEAITDDPDLDKRVLAPDGDDRRLKDMIRARLFRKKAAPVKIGRYTILDRLGEGGMGVVYTAYDDKLERKVAIKVMRSEGEGDSNGRNRLVREAQAMARLSHPNIVTVHEVGEVDGQVFVAMEFVRGQSLDFWLREARPWREVIDVYVQAGRGLAAAHAAGIIHRDFKPHNVLLGEDGTAKVLDFGLARSMGQLTGEVPEEEKAMVPAGERGLSLLDQRLTRTGAIMGTPAYMAPEQHQGTDATAKSDQFSFCVALYEALYGELPFEATSLATLIAAVVEGTIKEPPSGSKVPGWLRKVVLRGLAVEPEVRYPTIADLLAALGRDPVARRNRWLATAGFAVLVGGAGFGLASVGAAEAAVCTDATQEIAAVWNDDARAAVEAAIKGTGVAYADETWEKVAPKLDAYAEGWAAMRTEACESHRSGKHSARLYDLQTACLDLRLASLSGLVGALQSGDGAVENAVNAVASIPAIDLCADTARLTAAIAPPEDAATADAVHEARMKITEAASHELAGDYEAAASLLDAAQAAVKAGDYAPLAAELDLGRGSLALSMRDGAAAKESLSTALWSAIAAGHDRAALEAATKIIFVESFLAGDGDAALENVNLSRSLATRTNATASEEYLLLNNIGVAYQESGALVEAREAYNAAVEKIGASDHRAGLTLANLGTLDLMAYDFAGARDAFKRAQAILEATLGASHPDTILTRLNLAYALLGSGAVDDASAEFAALEPLALASLGAQSPALEWFNHGKANALAARREHDSAVALFRDTRAPALEHRGLEDQLVFTMTYDLASSLSESGHVDESLALHESIYELAKGGALSPSARAEALNMHGASLQRAGMHSEALRVLGEALELSEDKLPPNSPSLAVTLEKLARAQIALERHDDAAASLARARGIVDAELPEKSQLTAQVRRTEADLALARGDADAAVEHARAALVIHEATRDADDGELALSRFTLARALRAADASSGEATELAGKALQVLRAGGDGWAREADAIDAWLKG
ncbi:MAG: serine/threonine protein kinase [Myxococcales bacterium]|nr:serine/threonine protein kinase [Myxococcales bacterium]